VGKQWKQWQTLFSRAPLSRWCHPTISSSVFPFSSCFQSFPASGSFPMSWLFASGVQNIGASTSASVLPVNIQNWFILGLTGLISLQSKGLSRAKGLSFEDHSSFLSAVTICSHFGALENKVCHCFHCFPTYLTWSDGTGCYDLSFWMLSLKPASSLSSSWPAPDLVLLMIVCGVHTGDWGRTLRGEP